MEAGATVGEAGRSPAGNPHTGMWMEGTDSAPRKGRRGQMCHRKSEHVTLGQSARPSGSNSVSSRICLRSGWSRPVFLRFSLNLFFPKSLEVGADERV